MRDSFEEQKGTFILFKPWQHGQTDRKAFQLFPWAKHQTLFFANIWKEYSFVSEQEKTFKSQTTKIQKLE